MNTTIQASDRRNRSRLALHWNVCIFDDNGGFPLSTWTRDVSSEGFYCVVHKPFTPGDKIRCDIMIPPQPSPSQSPGTSLHCRIEVVRVEEAPRGGYGLACRIEEYSVSRWK